MSTKRSASDTTSRNSITPGATQRPPRLLGFAEHNPRFVVHIPFTAPTLGAALERTGLLADFFAFLPDIDQGETTVTYDGDQESHHRVICDQRLPNGARCPLRHGHVDQCGIG